MATLEHVKGRLADLTRRFVDFDIPLDREPTADELDSIACFKLLMHSELETYLEERVEQVIKNVSSAWTRSNALSGSAFMMLLRWSAEIEGSVQVMRAEPSSEAVSAIIELLVSKSLSLIKDNNGIKQRQFTSLSFLAGIVSDSHSATLLAALDAFSATRGHVAHIAVGRVRSISGPREEANNARVIVSLLEEFEQATALPNE